jgi:hypothetical protein
MATTYKLISSTTLSSTTQTVTISSIPSTYTDIVLQGYLAQTSGGNNWATFNIKINGNSGSNYSSNYMNSDGSTATAGDSGPTSGWYFDVLSPGGGTANPMGGFELYIPQYTNSAAKIARLIGGGAMDARNGIDFYSLIYNQTAAITSITITYSGGPETGFVSGSNFRLYGITASN